MIHLNVCVCACVQNAHDAVSEMELRGGEADERGVESCEGSEREQGEALTHFQIPPWGSPAPVLVNDVEIGNLKKCCDKQRA